MSALRDISAYAEALAKLMPRGRVWPEAGGRVWSELMASLAPELRRADARALQVIEEADPRTTAEGLEDWERVLGLPDQCAPVTSTIEERRAAVIALLRMEGGASRAYFIGLAAALGFTITISEHRPFRCGQSPVGRQGVVPPPVSPLAYFRVGFGGGQAGRRRLLFIDPDITLPTPDPADSRRIGSPLMRHVWRVTIAGRRFTHLRVGRGGGRAGRDRLFGIDLATALECLFDRLKPAQTRIVFDYAPLGSLVFTPFRVGYGRGRVGRDRLMTIQRIALPRDY